MSIVGRRTSAKCRRGHRKGNSTVVGLKPAHCLVSFTTTLPESFSYKRPAINCTRPGLLLGTFVVTPANERDAALAVIRLSGDRVKPVPNQSERNSTQSLDSPRI